MAEVDDTFDWRRQSEVGALYPWDEWLNGQTWKLTAAKDFSVAPITLRQYAYTIARGRGGVARTRQEGNTVWIQFLRPQNGGPK